MILLIFLLSTSHSANILLTAPFRGSHLYSLNTLATFLAEDGHNVTLISAGSDPKLVIHPNVSYIYPPEPGFGPMVRSMADLGRCMVSVVKTSRTSDASAIMNECQDPGRAAHKALTDYYLQEETENIITGSKIDLIIAEQRTSKPVAMIGIKHQIPLICYHPAMIGHSFPRLQQNLPFFLTSETSMQNSMIDGPPTFIQRLFTIIDTIRLGMLIHSTERQYQDNYERYGIASDQELHDHFSLFLFNDHPAYSLPRLLPGNVVSIGGYEMKPAKGLPKGPLSDFIKSSETDVILLSFGGVIDPYVHLSWFGDLVEFISQMNYRLILKIKTDPPHKLSEDIFVSKWLPQRDLLGSGKVKFHISHCGNNGRMESIYYNVPLLCIPLVADGLMNAVNVEQKHFGKILLKEEMTLHNVQEKISSMISNYEMFRDKMRIASDIVQNEPAHGKDKIRFYIDLLLKHGNLDFLQNQVLKQQSMIEVYNLDILLCLGAIVLISLGLVLFIIKMALCRIMQMVALNNKNKSD